MTEFQDSTLITMGVMGCQVQAIGEAITPLLQIRSKLFSYVFIVCQFFVCFCRNHKDMPKKTSKV